MIAYSDRADLARILSDDSWREFPLEMTEQGVEQFMKLTDKDVKGHVVYVHVESKTGQIIRIGKSLTGIHSRWTTTSDGHISTFMWSMCWKDKRYINKSLENPHYVLFFRQLAGKNTSVWRVLCEDENEECVGSAETTLKDYFDPIWEQFKRLSRRAGLRQGSPLSNTVNDRTFAEPRLPKIDGLGSKYPWTFPSL